MANHNTLFINVMTFIRRTGVSLPDIRLYKTYIWAVIGLLISQKPHLTHWQAYRFDPVLAASKTRQFSRWLHNPRIDPTDIYAQIVRAMLRYWIDQEIFIALDTTQLWKRFVIVRISLIYCGRAIPLHWKVVEGESPTVKFIVYRSMLDHVNRLVPSSCKVTFLADRAFGVIKLYRHLKLLNWHFHIRIKGNVIIHETPKQARRKMFRGQVSQLWPPPKQASFMNHIWVGERRYGPLHLALAHVQTLNGLEKWAIISDQRVSRRTFDEYGLRFCIEENFLDEKSAGFNLESSKIRDCEALSRLCLIIATATIYVVSTGKAIEAQGLVKKIDSHWFRGLSFFQIGWRWCRKVVFEGGWLLNFIWIPPDPDPEPSIASWKQFYRPFFAFESINYI